NGELSYMDKWRADNIRKAFQIADKTQVARQVFAHFPKIADTPLLKLIDAELLGNWREYHQRFKQHDSEWWLNWLVDVGAEKCKADPGETELVTALLGVEVDVRRRLEEIRAERLRVVEIHNPISYDHIGRRRQELAAQEAANQRERRERQRRFGSDY